MTTKAPTSVDGRSARSPFVLIVALVATAAMCAQNTGSALGFGWALTSDEVPIAVDHGSSVTSHEYDLQAMYQTIVTEGHQRCNIPISERWRRR